MRSIIYAGNDFSEICSAEVVGRSANPLAVEAVEMPGRAGALPVSAYMPPTDVRVRLFMDAGFRPEAPGMAALRAKVRSWLCQPGGGSLVLPDDPEIEYADVFLVGAAGWSNLLGTGECELTFTLFDPVGYGAERVERGELFEVGGTWPTLPEFRLVAEQGDGLQVRNVTDGGAIALDYGFAGGEAVILDCATESARIDGADARDRVSLGSDFFRLRPGPCELSATGCRCLEVRFPERWV